MKTKEDFLKIEDEAYDNDLSTDVLEYLADANSRNYNWSKLAEECIELAEVCIKKAHKKGGPKEPTMEQFYEELGDVLLRSDVIVKMENLDPDAFNKTLIDRIEQKCKKFFGYIKHEQFENI